MTVTSDPHPLLDAVVLDATWPSPVADLRSSALLDARCAATVAELGAATPEQVAAVRALLRHGGFAPSGRNKPCNEYIRRVADEGRFPRIDVVVDLTNAAVLHGGLPISTVDLDRLTAPCALRIAEPGATYVFNASGQTIALGGLLCLFDAEGPCANAVKDSQRGKTTPQTTRTRTVIWGTTAWPGRAQAVGEWLSDAMAAAGAVVTAG